MAVKKHKGATAWQAQIARLSKASPEVRERFRQRNCERQRAFQARRKAKIAAMEAAVAEASAPRSGGLETAGTAPEVLEALARIERLLSLQNARLTQATRIEHGERILRRLTELERLVRGDPGLVAVPKHTRRRPLGQT